MKQWCSLICMFKPFPSRRKLKRNRFIWLIVLVWFIVSLVTLKGWAGSYRLIMGACTAAGGGSVYGSQFWEMKPALQGVLVHNYIFEMWADMGYLALGASIDANIKARVRPDFYFDGVIRDIKPLRPSKTPADIVAQYRDQFKKYVETVYELNGHAYYPTIELIFYQLDPAKKEIRIMDEPYRINPRELGIETIGRTLKSLLEKLTEFLGTFGNLRAGVYDRKKKHVMLFGESSNAMGLKADDFLVASRAVFSNDACGAMVSIDPDPEHIKTRGIVRYGGDIEGTHIGHVLFESDRLLKCLGQGYDNLKNQPMTSQVEGYRSIADLLLEKQNYNQNKEEWIRFWFFPKEIEVASSDQYSIIVFPNNFLTVKTENMKFDGQKLVSDFTPDSTSPQGIFAEHFNAHFDEFAREWPVFREVQEISKVVALFRWFHDQEIDLDISYLGAAELRKFPSYQYTPLITSTRSFTRTQTQRDSFITKQIVILRLIGGVDLQNFKFKQMPADKYEDLVNAIQQHPDNIPFKYGDVMGKRLFFATVAIPNMELRKALYHHCYEIIPPEIRDQIKLGMDAYGRVIIYTDSEDHSYYFEYDDSGRLKSVRTWDQPIHYEFHTEAGQISFRYEIFSNTNEYLKCFEYASGSDQVQWVKIYRNGELQHAFSVRVEENEVIIERECK